MAAVQEPAGTAGTDGLGGGGGASGWGPGSFPPGVGGDGVVIISVPTENYAKSEGTTGSPTVTTSGTNTILTYTATGTYKP